MSPSLLDFLKHIEHECGFLTRVTAGKTLDEVFNDEILSKAIVRSLEIIGEAVKKLDDDFKKQHPSMEWKKIAGTRDIMIHHYFGIDYDIVWEVITEKIPPLHKYIHEIIKAEKKNG
ncbi:MAG: DUF86 domain-containing protein [Bacteroidia bacterium]|nr:DUF86 domain-containing protein [Bacteroidia bacterium]